MSTAPYYWVSPSSLSYGSVVLGTVRDMTTGLYEMVYGVAYGTNGLGYYFIFCPCKTNSSGITDPRWGYWIPSTNDIVSKPWIVSPSPAVSRLRTIVSGQEAQNGYCVSNQDPCIYFGSGGGTAFLYQYLPVTPDLNLDQTVDILDAIIMSNQFGADPPAAGTPTGTPTPLIPVIIGVVIATAIIAGATVYRVRRRKITKNNL